MKAKWAVLIGALLLIFVSGGILMNQKKETGQQLMTVEELAKMEALETRLKATYTPGRDYGYGTVGNRRFLITDIFKNLPAIPETFWRMKYNLMSGRVGEIDLCNISEEYFLQPEFYANTFIESGLQFWRTPDLTHWYPEGYGNFPIEVGVATRPGTSFETCTFFHSSWGVERWQGIGLKTIYPSTISDAEGNSVSVNSEEAKKYFRTEIIPNEVLVAPTYPIFRKEWAEKIRFRVTVSNDTPAGVYALGFDVTSISLETNKKWSNEYIESYQSMSGFRTSQPQFKLKVDVMKD